MATPPTPPPAGRSTLGVIFLTLFLDLAGFSIIFPLSPALLEHYLEVEKLEGREGLLGSMIAAIESASPLSRTDPVFTAALFGGLLGSIYALLQFLFAPFWGSLSDRTGRRPVLLISVGGIALSYLLWAVSGSFALFILARFLGGAMGGNISVATAAAADISTREDRAKAMGIVGAAFGLGFILGPALGGWLSSYNLAASFPELARFGLNPFSACALGAFVLALLNLVWLLARFRETLAPEARGRAGERRTINPLRLFQRFDFPGIRAVNVIYFIYLLAFAGMEFTLTFLAAERFQYTPRDMMWFFVFAGFLMALVQGGLVRRLAPRLGERRLAVLGLIAVLPGFVLMGIAPWPWVVYLGLFFMSVGSGLVTPAITALVSLYTPADRQGGVLGIFRSAGSFARALGPIAGTAVFWRFGSLWTYLLGAVLIIPAAALALGLPPPGERPE